MRAQLRVCGCNGVSYGSHRGGTPPSFICRNSPRLRLHRVTRTRAAAGNDGASSADNDTAITSATQAVELGLMRFQNGDAEAALRLFLRAQNLRPSIDEARAALYNAACAYTKLKRWHEAAESVVNAVNEYDLKLSVALRDPDLAPLRERREWTTALQGIAGGVSDEIYLKLKSEARSPFRLIRVLLFGGLAAGASLGLIISSSRLVAALQAVQGAPDLSETVRNFGINAAGLAVLSYLLFRDFSGERKEKDIIAKEEALATLQVSMGPERVLPLASFRGTSRLVVLAGSKGQVARAVAAAEPFKDDLIARGVTLVPVTLNAEDMDERLRRLKVELSSDGESPRGGTPLPGRDSGGPHTPLGFGNVASPTNDKDLPPSKSPSKPKRDGKDRKWQLEPYDLPEWEGWVKGQIKGIDSGGASMYVQIQLDGTVRASGIGVPPWKQFLEDIPEMDSVRTKLTDGRGMQ